MQLLFSSFYVGNRGELSWLTWKTKLMQSCHLYLHLLLVDPFQPNLSKEGRLQRCEFVKFCVQLHLGGRVCGEGVFMHNCPSYRVLFSFRHGNSSSGWPLSTCILSVYSTCALLQTRHGNTLCFAQTVGQPRVKEETRREFGGIVIGKAEETH